MMKKTIIGLTLLASMAGISVPAFASEAVQAKDTNEVKIEQALNNEKLPELANTRSVDYDKVLDENAPWNISTYARAASFNFKNSKVGQWHYGIANWYVPSARNMNLGLVQWGDGTTAKVQYSATNTNTGRYYQEHTLFGNMNPTYTDNEWAAQGDYKMNVKPIRPLSSGNGHVYTN